MGTVLVAWSFPTLTSRETGLGEPPPRFPNTSSALPTTTRTPAPRFACAKIAVTGSASIPVTAIPTAAKARASAPSPHPTSTTSCTPAWQNRPARQAATDARVACSNPSGVKNIRPAASPNFATARRRNDACVNAAAARSGGHSRRTASAAASSSGSAKVSARASASRASSDVTQRANSVFIRPSSTMQV